MATPFLEPGGALSGRLAGELLGRDTATVAPGTRLGPYCVLRELDRGGLGVVYLGERADGAFEQQVALKLIRPDSERGLAETLLERERRILAKLQHPGIARIVDGGCAAGAIWFAMDYIEGERIDRYCRERHLDGQARLELIRKVSEAVAYAHARLVVHRDIKPANILVDTGGEPRLLDFGIAAALDEAEQADPGRRASTPGFASPEQRRGEATGIAADVYQLGRLLETLMHGVTVTDRRGLSAVRERALNVLPDHRYPNAEAFAADIRNLLAKRPVTVCDQQRGYRSLLFLRRHAIGSLATLIGCVAFLSTVVYFVWSLDAARQRAEREAATAQRISDFMVGVFDNADPGIHLGEEPSLGVLLARGRERIESELADEPALKGELLATLGRVHWMLDDRDNALPLLREAVALGEADDEITPEALASRKHLLAQTLSLEHHSQDSRTQLNEALALISGKTNQADLQSSVLRQLDVVDCYEGNVQGSISRLSAAIDEARNTPDESSPEFVSNLLYLGLFRLEMGQLDEALPLLTEAHDRTLHSKGADHPQTAQQAALLATALCQAGQFDDAEQLAREALEKTRHVFGEHSARFAFILGRYGEVAYWQGDIDTAIERYRKSIQLADELPSGSDINSSGTLSDLGDAYMAVDRPIEAEAAYREMLLRDRDGGRALGPDVGDGPLRLARALAAQGRCDEAAVSLQQAHARAADFPPEYGIHKELKKPLAGCAAIHQGPSDVRDPTAG